jgi:hypothetical protein
MEPKRHLRIRDHRLVQLVQETGDATIATRLGVPRSTVAGRLRRAPCTVTAAADGDRSLLLRILAPDPSLVRIPALDKVRLLRAADYRHVPTSRLAVLAQRIGAVFASPTTWLRLVMQRGWRRPRLRVHPERPRVGIRADVRNPSPDPSSSADRARSCSPARQALTRCTVGRIASPPETTKDSKPFARRSSSSSSIGGYAIAPQGRPVFGCFEVASQSRHAPDSS